MIKFLFLSTLIFSLQFGFGQNNSDAKIGANQYKMLELTYGFYENPELLSVVEEIGNKLEEQIDLGYELNYTLLDMEEPNAFATTGGYVYVTRGLLALINTEDELAGIIGHELSHVILKHGSKKTYGNILPSILKIPGNIINLITNSNAGNILNTPIDITTDATMSGFSRDMESNADKLGVEIATKAGYYPYALGDVLVRLNDYSEYLIDRKIEKSIFNDHPMTPKRVEKIIKINEDNGLKREPTFPGTPIKELDLLIYGQNPSAGLIKDSAFIHLSIGMYCEFPSEWDINNTPESVSALSDDKKALIVVSIDESKTIDIALEKELKKYSNSQPLLKQKIKVNGLNGYKLNLKISAYKEEDRLLKIMWVEFPESTFPIKIQAISNIADFPEAKVERSLESFRKVSSEDFLTFEFSTIRLKESSYKIESDKKLLEILNNLETMEDVPENRFIKEIESHPLSERSNDIKN